MSRIDSIDVARAFAVISVVLFHADEALLPGGFLGVDLFYVISGFVVSKSISEHYKGYWNFLLRRFFRLAPSAIVTILTTIVILGVTGYDLLDTKHYLSAIYALLFTSNFYFAFDISYFDPVAQGNPFLHFWSLNVEEQFYLLWPLVCLPFLRLRTFWIVTLVSVWFIFSFAFWVYAPEISFFMMPYRISQFSSGALIYVLLSRQNISLANLTTSANTLILASTYVILFAVMLLVDGSSHWVFNFLIPTVLSFLLLFAGLFRTVGERWILTSALTFLGRASYSIYLVHWPLTVFFHLKYGTNLTSLAAIVLISIALGIALHMAIEKQFKYTTDGTLFLFGTKAKGQTTFAKRNKKRVRLVGAISSILPVMIVFSMLQTNSVLGVTEGKQLDQDDIIQGAEAHLRLLTQTSAEITKLQNGTDTNLQSTKTASLQSERQLNGVSDDSLKDKGEGQASKSNTENSKNGFVRTQSIESLMRLQITAPKRKKATKKLWSCNTYEIGRREGNLNAKLLEDLDLEKCLSGDVILFTDSTNNLAAQFIASVYKDFSELAVLSSAGCNFQRPVFEVTVPDNDCHKINKLRTDILMSSSKSYSKIFYAFKNPPSNFEWLGNSNKKIMFMSMQPRFTDTVDRIVKVRGNNVDLRDFLAEDFFEKQRVQKIEADKYANIEYVQWSILDDKSSKTIRAIDLKGELKYKDKYHQSQNGIENTIREYFLNNCDIDGWENTCKLPHS